IRSVNWSTPWGVETAFMPTMRMRRMRSGLHARSVDQHEQHCVLTPSPAWRAVVRHADADREVALSQQLVREFDCIQGLCFPGEAAHGAVKRLRHLRHQLVECVTRRRLPVVNARELFGDARWIAD